MDLASKENGVVTRRGKPLARLTSPYENRNPVDDFLSLAGVFASSDFDYQKLLDQRRSSR